MKLAILTVLAILLAGPAVAKDDTVDFGAAVEISTKEGHCTAFHIGHGQLVTAAHCIQKLDEGQDVTTDTGATLGGRAMPVLVDQGTDVAIMSLGKEWSKHLASLRVDCGMVHIGQDVEIRGWPLELGYIVTWGRVAGLPRKQGDDTPLFIIQGLIDHGNSGGPVIDSSTGKVVGILDAFYSRPMDKNVYDEAVPASVACRLADIS